MAGLFAALDNQSACGIILLNMTNLFLKTSILIVFVLCCGVQSALPFTIEIAGIDGDCKGNTNTAVIKYCSISGKLRLVANKIRGAMNANYSEEFRANKLDDYLDRNYGGELNNINKQLEELGISNRVNVVNVWSQTGEIEDCFLLRIKADYGVPDLLYHKVIQCNASERQINIRNGTFLILKVQNTYTRVRSTYTSADDYYRDKVDENASQGYSSMYIYDRNETFVSRHKESKTEEIIIQPFQVGIVTR